MVTKIKQSGIDNGAVGQAQLGADSVTAAKIVDGAVGVAEIAADGVGASEIAAGAVGTSEIADGTITTDDIATSARPAFTKSFESTQQTITSGGALTLAHGLVAKPKLVQLALVCQTAEFNYSIGDEIIVPNGLAQESTNNRGIGVLIDATNVTIRFGSAASVLTIQNKTTGNTAIITNANWKLVVRAFA